MKYKKNIINIINLIIVSIIFLLPYLVMILSCFSTSAAIKGNSILSNISIINLIDNWNSLSEQKYFFSSLINSFYIAVFATTISVLISSLAGYAYTIYKSKSMDKLFTLSFLAIMVPTVINIIPLFLIFKMVGMIDTYAAVIICCISLPFNIYLFKQNTRLMPIELIKAARIDGLSEFEIFYKVYIPCMSAVFITSSLLSFLEAWSALLLPAVILQSQSKFTNALYLNSLGTIWSCDYAVLMLSLVISTMPIIILFIIFQKYIKNGISGIS
ncbi:MAG: carbohydrate ABC transporter permease [Bacilli bacterium]|nr:carbohydrate ABC transporter permease [Bacilli bacterium]